VTARHARRYIQGESDGDVGWSENYAKMQRDDMVPNAGHMGEVLRQALLSIGSHSQCFRDVAVVD